MSLIQRFGKENLLKLNARQCRVVVFASDSHAAYPECKIAEQAISVGSEGKCLGYCMLARRLDGKPCCRGGIKKTRRRFFHYDAIRVT